MLEDPSPNEELARAEIAATDGPVFSLWRLDAEATQAVVTELALFRVQYAVSNDGDLLVHSNDGTVARQIIERLCGDGLEVEIIEDDQPEPSAVAELVTVYTAGDLHQANLISARLRSVGIQTRLKYDSAIGVAAHLAKDRTVQVQVVTDDVARSNDELGGVDTDFGSDLPFESRAWATPMRRLGARSLLLSLGLFVAPILIVVAVVLYEFVAP